MCNGWETDFLPLVVLARRGALPVKISTGSNFPIEIPENSTKLLPDLFSRRFREGISFPKFVERSILKLSLSKLCAVPLALQNRSLFEGGEKGEKVSRQGEEEGWQAKGAKRKKGRGKTSQLPLLVLNLVKLLPFSTVLVIFWAANGRLWTAACLLPSEFLSSPLSACPMHASHMAWVFKEGLQDLRFLSLSGSLSRYTLSRAEIALSFSCNAPLSCISP